MIRQLLALLFVITGLSGAFSPVEARVAARQSVQMQLASEPGAVAQPCRHSQPLAEAGRVPSAMPAPWHMVQTVTFQAGPGCYIGIDRAHE